MKSLLMKGVAWIAAARLLMAIIGFASTVALARLLTPEDFGLVALAGAAATIMTAITELSLSQALIRTEHLEDDHFNTAWTLGVIRAAALSVLLVALSFPLSAIYEDHRLREIFWVFAFGTFISGLFNPKMILFERDLIFSKVMLLNLLDRFSGFIVAVVIALIWRSYWALVISTLLAQLIRSVASYLFIPYRPRFSLGKYKSLLSFSVWLTLGGGVNALNQQSDPLILGAFVPPSSLGLYSVGSRTAAMSVGQTLGPISETLFPAFSHIKGDRARLRKAYQRAQALLCTIAFPAGAGLAALAEPITYLLLGQKWLPAVPILQVFAVVAALHGLNNCRAIAMATGHTKALFGRDLRAAAIRIPLFIGGTLLGMTTPLGAIVGAAFGSALATLVHISLNIGLVRTLVGLRYRDQLSVGLRPAIASAVMAAALQLLPLGLEELSELPAGVFALVGLIGFGALIYITVLMALWLAQGRTEGPETELIGVIKVATGKAGRRVAKIVKW